MRSAGHIPGGFRGMSSSRTVPESRAPFSSTCFPEMLPVPHCPVSHLSTLSIPPTPCDPASSILPGLPSLHERFQKAKADWRRGGQVGRWAGHSLTRPSPGSPPGPQCCLSSGVETDRVGEVRAGAGSGKQAGCLRASVGARGSRRHDPQGVWAGFSALCCRPALPSAGRAHIHTSRGVLLQALHWGAKRVPWR